MTSREGEAARAMPGGPFQVGTPPCWVSLRPQWLRFASPFGGTQGQPDKDSTRGQVREDWGSTQTGAAWLTVGTSGTQPGSTGDLRKRATSQSTWLTENHSIVPARLRDLPPGSQRGERRRAVQSGTRAGGPARDETLV